MRAVFESIPTPVSKTVFVLLPLRVSEIPISSASLPEMAKIIFRCVTVWLSVNVPIIAPFFESVFITVSTYAFVLFPVRTSKVVM